MHEQGLTKNELLKTFPAFLKRKEKNNNATGAASTPLPKREPIPSMAVAVSYQLKKVKRSGTYKNRSE
jgi:hypothetical protein